MDPTLGWGPRMGPGELSPTQFPTLPGGCVKEKDEMGSGARMLGSDSHSATDQLCDLGQVT